MDRRVNTGQTVVASLNAPSLFLIAKDLKKMQVWAAVNEADIGNIHPGQAVTFTVDAFPGHTFHGEVNKIRLNASMTQNVVTYTVEINTDNSDGKLLPYLTANVQFEVAERRNVLLVPNAALRWTPAPETIVPDARKQYGSRGQHGSPSTREADRPDNGGRDVPAEGTVWIQEGRFVRPARVTVGLTDGVLTEIQSGDVVEEAQVVVGESQRSQRDDTTNPFTPRLGGGRRG